MALPLGGMGLGPVRKLDVKIDLIWSHLPRQTWKHRQFHTKPSMFVSVYVTRIHYVTVSDYVAESEGFKCHDKGTLLSAKVQKSSF